LITSSVQNTDGARPSPPAEPRLQVRGRVIRFEAPQPRRPGWYLRCAVS